MKHMLCCMCSDFNPASCRRDFAVFSRDLLCFDILWYAGDET